MADSVPGVQAMLRAGVVVVVDGYNVSKTAWPDATLAVQRESLARALDGLHLTTGAEVVVVFDGDGTRHWSNLRRPGLRVVFSDPGVEADTVVVDLVTRAPAGAPVVVVSSDRWVHEHAERRGAVVVSSATLVGLLHGPGPRG